MSGWTIEVEPWRSQDEVNGLMDEVLGDDAAAKSGGGGGGGGFDWSMLIPATAEIAQKGIQTYQAKEQAGKQSAEDKAKLDKAIQADAAWANAEAVLDLANSAKDASKIAAAQTLQQSAYAQAMAAGAGLSPASAGKRTAADQQAASDAAQDALSNPKDLAKQAKMRAWQKVVAVASAAAQPTPADQAAAAKYSREHGGGGGSFLTKYHAGVPMWGWLVGGTVGVTGLGLLIRSLLKKKR